MNKFWKVVLPIVALLIGAGAGAALLSSRKTPERVERKTLGPLVEVVTAQTASIRVQVHGQGEVRASTRVDLLAEVSGRAIEVHPSLVTGGRFRAGEVLVRIEPRDYELAVERARAGVARAKVQLEREQAEGAAARAEWQELHGEAEPPPLAVREPQIRQAEAEVAAAQADLASTELNLERTAVRLPFAGVVISENVDQGQLITQGRVIASVYGTREVEIRVPLADRELAWFDWQGTARGSGGTPVAVTAEFAGSQHRWQGRVDRAEGLIDSKSRMAHVVVVVEDPFAPSKEAPERPPLLPGTFVDVAIQGKQLDDIVILPRYAAHDEDHIWLAVGEAPEHRLEMRQVQILRQDRDSIFVGEGLTAGDQIILSSLDAVTDGMTIRIEPADKEVAP